MEKPTEEPPTPEKRYGLRERKVKHEIISEDEEETPKVEKKRKRNSVGAKPEKPEKKIKTEKKESKRAKIAPFHPDDETKKNIEKFKEEKQGKYSTDCCNTCTSREVIRIASEKKLKDLKEILDDVKHVSTPFINKTQKVDENVFDIAFKNNDLEMLKILMKEKKEPKKRTTDSHQSLNNRRNQSRNHYGHGLKNISQGKGNKEGNDAFNEHFENDRYDRNSKSILRKVQKYKLSKEILDFLSVEAEGFSGYMGYDVGFYQCVESGNLENAQYIAKHLKDEGDGSGLNNLHVESLGDGNEDFSKVLAISVTKKATSNFKITPLHTAAINKTNKHLKELMIKASEKSISGHHVIDALQRKPIHFAAVSDTSDNLKYLVEECNSDPVEADKSKMNPFLLACKYGKLHNVKYLTSDKYPQMVHSKNSFRETGLQLAARYGHLKVVEYLLTVGSDVSYKNTKGETALSLACQYGHFDVVKALIASKFDIHQELKGDKFKKTPLHHSVMNGHFDITKLLLLNGFDPNSVDSSNNAVIHYAAAFGYSNILSLLSIAGGILNVVSDWSTSPLSISLIKGHLKTSNIILKDSSVDVNFVDNENKTMLHQLLQSKEGNFDRQIKYLVEDKKARTDILTVDGTSLLHVLSSSVHEKDVEIATLLISHGMDVNQTDNRGMSSFLMACESGNVPLIELYLQQKKINIYQLNSENQNFLHLLHKNVNEKDILSVLNVIIPHVKSVKKWEELRNQYDNFGYTPMLLLFSHFHNNTQLINNQAIVEETNDVSEDHDEGSGDESDTMNQTAESEIMEDDEEDEHEEDEHEDDANNTLNISETSEHQEKQVLIENTGKDASKFMEYTKLLLTHYSNDVNFQIKKSDDKKKESNHIGYSILHFLANDAIPNVELLELFTTTYKTNVNIVDELKRNPLHISFKTQKKSKGFEFDGMLLSKGCDINALDAYNRTPLFYVFIQSKVNEHTYWDWESQIQRNFKFSSDPIEIISDVFSFTDFIKINQKDNYGRTLLHEACLKGATTCSMFLIQKGSLIEEEDEDKNTPLCLALISGFKDLGITLINKNANSKRILKVLSKPEKEHEKVKVVDEVVNYAKTGFRVRQNNDEGFEEPIMSIFKFILKKDWMGLAYLILTDIEPMSAVNDALETENYQLVLTLISKTNSTKLKEIDGSKQNIFHKIASFQPKLNSDMEKKISSFHHFSKKIFVELKRKLNEKDIEQSMLNQQDGFGKTPLHYAAETGNAPLCKCLFEGNSRIIDMDDGKGMTALMYACKFNHLPVVKTLIEHKSNINKLDKENRSALIHFIHPCELGSFENVELLTYLIKHGALTDKKDKNNKSAVQYASMKFSKTLYNEMIKLGAKAEKSTSIQSSQSVARFKEINFESDFKHALKEIKESEMEIEESDETVKVDERSGLKNCQVLKGNDKYYDVLLSKADVLKGPFGYYLFYKLQIIFNPIQKLYILFNCWGRWGDQGEFQRTPFKSEADAVKEFKSLYKSKTKNDWDSTGEFEEHIGSYVILKLKKKKKFNRLPVLNVDKSNSDLDVDVFNLMTEITSVTSMTKSLNSIGVTASMMPFGNLEDGVLKRGIEILKKIYVLLKEIENNHEISPKDKKEKYYEMAKESNKFYQLIPHQGFEDSALGLIRSEFEIAQKIKMMDLLMNLEISSRIIITANNNLNKMNPIDYCYYSLYNHVKKLDKSSFEFNILNQYISRTILNGYELLNIFTIQRKGEEERFKKHEKDENRVLLWHGSSISNFIGILSQGLRIAPPEAPAAGYAFGKGIYFADQFSKSVGYADDQYSSHSLLLLCEVALGKISQLSSPQYMEKPMDGFNSTQGVGRKSPSLNESFITNDGLKIPCGPIHEQIRREDVNYHKHIENNEFIVYDESQVKMKYLVVVRKIKNI